jgi:ABC-type polysaccharide/polyol phosphate export permease
VSSLTANTNLVTKVYFPREIFPFSAVIVSAVDFAVGAILLVGFMAYYRMPPTPALLFLPLIVIVEIMFAAGVSLVLAMSNLFYRDVKYLFEVAITAWMFATSVLYPLDQISGRAGVLLRLNPMSIIVDAYRDVLLRGVLPPLLPFFAAAAVAMAVLAVGWLQFHRAEFQFAENV